MSSDLGTDSTALVDVVPIAVVLCVWGQIGYFGMRIILC